METLQLAKSNLEGLSEHEAQIFASHLSAIYESTELSEHLEAIHASLHYLRGLHDLAPSKAPPNVLPLYWLEVRLFNSASCAMKLALNGYINGATSFIRDIVEIGLRLDYFLLSENCAERWSKDSNAKEFKPAKIRKALDARDGNKESLRANYYQFYSSHGSHADFSGIKLTSNEGGLVFGPFLNLKAIGPFLLDLSRFLGHAVGLLGQNLGRAGMRQKFEHQKVYEEVMKKWFLKYQGIDLQKRVK